MKISELKLLAEDTTHGPWISPGTVLALISRIEQMTLSLKSISNGRWDYKDQAKLAVKLYGRDVDLEPCEPKK